jgi:hypothetical protein
VPEARFHGWSLAITLLGVTLGGCSMNLDSLNTATLNPFKGSDPFHTSDYNYFYKSEAAKSGPITAADLVDPDGRCAFAPAPVPAPVLGPAAPPPAAEEPVAAAPGDPINPRSNSALYFTAGPQSGPPTPPPGGAIPPEVRNGPRGISLAMTECQVVSVAGYTNQVEIGTNARGERTVTLTYLSGDRPGIYHFRGGRLMLMERVAEPETPPKKPTKIKTAKAPKKKPLPPQ